MSAPVPSTRRIAVAIGTAAASATVAIGVTAASLLGWFSPTAGPPVPEPAAETSAPAPTPASSPVILVPVSPTPAAQPTTDSVGDLQVAMDVGGRGRADAHDDDSHDQLGRDHDDDEEESDDD